MITIALYQDEKDNEPTSIEVSWAELSAMLTADNPSACTAATCVGKKCPHKSSDGENPGAWSPVIIEERRSNDNVQGVTALVLDGDGVTEAQLQTVAERVQGASFVIHTTHRHRPGANFVRLVLALSRPVLPNEWSRFYDNALSGLGFTGIFDPRVKDLSRLFFFPSHPSDVSFLSDAGEGEVLDVDAVLALDPMPAPAPDTGSPSTSSSPPSAITFETVIGQLQFYVRSRAQGDALDKEQAQMISRLMAGKPLAAPGGNADPTPIMPPADLVPGRGYAIMRTAAILTMWLPTDTTDEIYLELFRNSITAMCFGRISDRKEMEEQLLEKLRLGRLRREEWDKEALERNKTAKAFMQAREEERARKREAAAQAKAEGVEGEVAEADDWLSKLEFPKGGDDDKGPKGTAYNAFLILSNAEEFKDLFRWDDVHLKVVAGEPFTATEQEVLADEVANYLSEKWGLTLDARVVWRQILVVAYRNRFDPIHDYLRGLVWDGVSRVEGWLTTYANVEKTAFSIKAGRKWLIGSVARGLNPGVKHDCVLVLEGKQGRRKSTLFEVLGGDFYAAVSLTVADKDSKMVSGRAWISELPDLAALKKVGEINALKAFFSTRKDTFRPPYGRAVIDSPRRNSFAGTTNEDEYLIDHTGNRRYWVAKCMAPINMALIMRDRDQLWAEAVVLYDKHVNECEDKLTCGCWWFHDEESEEPEIENIERVQESPMETAIEEWWGMMTPDTRPREMTTFYIAKQVLEFSVDKITRDVATRVGIALLALGFSKQRRRFEDTDGKKHRSWFYVPTEELIAMPQSEAGKKMKFKVIKGGVDDGGTRKE